jgi:hypothetical protein
VRSVAGLVHLCRPHARAQQMAPVLQHAALALQRAALRLQQADMDLRKTLFLHIVLSGGSTLFPGFGDRLLSEAPPLPTALPSASTREYFRYPFRLSALGGSTALLTRNAPGASIAHLGREGGSVGSWGHGGDCEPGNEVASEGV